MLLCEYNVPLIRATWFIKLSSAYTIAVSEAKIKSKRQLPDPTLGMSNAFNDKVINLIFIYITNTIFRMDKHTIKVHKRTTNQTSRLLSKCKFIDEFDSISVNDRGAKSFT